MNANNNKSIALNFAGDASIELRKRVERLEEIRADACLSHDHESVELIDKMIKDLVMEWSGSFAQDGRKLRKVG